MITVEGNLAFLGREGLKIGMKLDWMPQRMLYITRALNISGDELVERVSHYLSLHPERMHQLASFLEMGMKLGRTFHLLDSNRVLLRDEGDGWKEFLFKAWFRPFGISRETKWRLAYNPRTSSFRLRTGFRGGDGEEAGIDILWSLNGAETVEGGVVLRTGTMVRDERGRRCFKVDGEYTGCAAEVRTMAIKAASEMVAQAEKEYGRRDGQE
jgi:hypothetical protein